MSKKEHGAILALPSRGGVGGADFSLPQDRIYILSSLKVHCGSFVFVFFFGVWGCGAPPPG